MTDGEALLAAILANPADDTARLVYADWLQEQGEEERAVYIRWAIERNTPCSLCPGDRAIAVVRMPNGGTEFVIVEESIKDVAFTVCRGFVSEIRLPLAAWELHAAAIWSRQPVMRVVIIGKRPTAANRGLAWYRAERENPNIVEIPESANLPDDLFWAVHADPRKLSASGYPVSSRWAAFPTEEIALDALSRACCVVGRQRARKPVTV